MKFHMLGALSMLIVACPSAAQNYQLECETEDIQSTSYDYNQEIRNVSIDIVNYTIDPVAKTAFITGQRPDGTQLSVLRELLVVSPQQLILCQADVCQKEFVEGLRTTRISLTVIDLTTGKFSRNAEEKTTDPDSSLRLERRTVRTGICRRL